MSSSDEYPEIKITPDMIDAVADTIAAHLDRPPYLFEGLAEEIFTQLIKIERSRSSDLSNLSSP